MAGGNTTGSSDNESRDSLNIDEYENQNISKNTVVPVPIFKNASLSSETNILTNKNTNT